MDSRRQLMHRFLCILALFACLTACASGENDTSYIAWLEKNGLDAETCALVPPAMLFKTTMEQEELGYGGTPGHEATVVDAFYAKYLLALQPHNDAKHPDMATSRANLREIFYLVNTTFTRAYGARSYAKLARVDALVEHLISRFSDAGIPAGAHALDFSAEEAATYVRARYALLSKEGVDPPDYDGFRAKLAALLHQFAKEQDERAGRILHYYLALFADNHQTPLTPYLPAPDQPDLQ